MENMKLCEIHYLQGRHRQYKEKVPESLKLQRKKKSKKSQGGKETTASSELGIRVERVKMKRKVKKPARVSGLEAALLDETLRKMKSKKKGNLQLELIRMVLKRDLEKKKKNKKKNKKSDFSSVKMKKNMKSKQNEIELEDNSEEEEEEELTRQLPNGVMAISPVPSPSPRNFNNVDGNCDVKVGVENGVVRRRCFRSKNIEPLPFGTMQVLIVFFFFFTFFLCLCLLLFDWFLTDFIKCSSCLVVRMWRNQGGERGRGGAIGVEEAAR